MATSAAVLTVDELASTLRIGRRQCYELVKRDEVPGVIRVGKSIRISRAAIDAWLTNGDGSPCAGCGRMASTEGLRYGLCWDCTEGQP